MRSGLEIALFAGVLGLGTAWLWEKYKNWTLQELCAEAQEKNLGTFLKEHQLSRGDLENSPYKFRPLGKEGQVTSIRREDGKVFHLYFGEYGFSHGKEY